MRKIYFLLVLLAFTNSLFSQNSDLKSFDAKSTQFHLTGIDNSISTTWDLNNISPIFSQNGNSQILAKTDTLNQFVKSSTGFTTYAVTIQGNTYPLTGWNPYYYFLGQKFNINGTAKVTEILFSAISKMFLGANIDSIRGFVFSAEPTQGLPSATIGSGFIMFDKIDTNSTKPVYSSIKFDTPVPVDSKFVTMLLTFNNTNEYDAVILYSNMQGDGKNQKNLCMIFNNNGNLNAMNYTDFWNQVGLKMNDGNPPDFDALIFPIIDTGTGVNEGISINGITLNNVSPNPANDRAVFNFNLEEPTSVTINLVGMDGKSLQSITQENCATGEHQIQFDLSSISSGSYYYLITTNNSKFGGKLNIVR